MPFVSRYLQIVPYNEDFSIIWHAVFGRPMLVTRTLANALAHSTYFSLEDIFGENYENDQISLKAIADLEDAHIILTKTSIMARTYEGYEALEIRNLFVRHDAYGKDKIKKLTLILSESSRHCCEHYVRLPDSGHAINFANKMPYDMARTCIEEYLDMVQDNGLGQAHIHLGGEPCLNRFVIHELISYIDAQNYSRPFRINTSIDVGPALFRNVNIGRLDACGIEVIVGLDGPFFEDIPGGSSGIRDRIVPVLDHLWRVGNPSSSFLSLMVAKDNPCIDTCVIDLAAEYNLKGIYIGVDAVGLSEHQTKNAIDMLTKMYEYASEKGVLLLGPWLRPASNLGVIPERSDIGFCDGEMGRSICVVPSGQVFPCAGCRHTSLAHYSDIRQLHSCDGYQSILSRRSILELEGCQSCSILGFCRGGCMSKDPMLAPRGDSPMCKLNRAIAQNLLIRAASGLQNSAANVDISRPMVVGAIQAPTTQPNQ